MIHPINIKDHPVLSDYPAMRNGMNAQKGGTRLSGFPSSFSTSAPLVSILTICCNGMKTIEKTIRSVLAQTYANIEYIIIDGGSTDGTLEIIRRYEDKIAYWISEPDNGISDAFNKGIAAATGDIIGIINADDYYEATAVELAVSILIKTATDIVHGMVQYRDLKGQKTELFSGNDALLHKDMTVNHPSVFAKRSAYEKIGLFRTDFRYAMDYEWLLRAKISGLNFSYIDKCLSHVRLAGASDRNWKYARLEVAKAKDIHCPGISNRIFYSFQIVKGSCRRFFEMVGLGCIVEFYHRHISYLKKVKSN